MPPTLSLSRYLFPSLVYLFLTILHFGCASLDPKIIPLSQLKNCTISSESPLLFQVIKDLSLAIGRFDVSVTPKSAEDSPDIFISHQTCAYAQELANHSSYDQIFLPKGFFNLSFYGNKSENQCFKVELLNKIKTSLDFSIIVKFTQLDTIIQPRNPFDFEINKGFEKLIAYDLNDHPADLLMVEIKMNFLPSNLQYLELKYDHHTTVCVQSQANISSSKLWLCNIFEPQRLIFFSIDNCGNPGSFQMIINDIKPIELDLDVEQTFSTSIPYFGNLFAVNLSDIGILKVKAESQKNNRIPIVASLMLPTLFRALKQEINWFNGLDAGRDKKGNLFLHNEITNSRWYYFIPETKPGHFSLKSHFITELYIGVDSQIKVFIDPEVSEYQHIKLSFGRKNFIEKYEAVLSSSYPDALVSIFYDPNFDDIMYYKYQDQNPILSQDSSARISDSQIYLSFIVGVYDNAAYLIIRASKKGYYELKVRTMDSRSYINIIFTITLISYLFIYLYACLYRRKIPPILSSSNTSTLEIDTRQAQIIIQSGNDDNEIGIKIQNIVERLQQLKDIKLMGESKGKENQSYPSDIHQNMASLDISDENETCDICYESTKTVMFLPCNHTCTCVCCALAIIETSLKCPLCRGQIIEIEILSTDR